LIEYIPWLGGRLRAESDDSFAFALSDRPRVLLEVASSNNMFDELSDQEAVRRVRALDGEPLVSARLTQTPGGSVLAVSMSHALVDGFSFFLMMSKWAACTRGEPIEAPPQTRQLNASETSVAAARPQLTQRMLLEESGLFWAKQRPHVHELPVQERIQLSASAIADLLADSQRDVAGKLRQNDVLTAWLWRSYGTQWWAGQGNPDVYVSCPVDMRRLLGQTNAALFGSTICFATASASYAELKDLPLGELALRVQSAVAKVFSAGVDKRVAPLEALRQQHGQKAMESVHLRHPRHGMLVTNMSRLPLAQLDFGSGAPVGVRLYVEIDSMAAVLPAPDGVTLGIYRPATARESSREAQS
jgi:hypothetical protein